MARCNPKLLLFYKTTVKSFFVVILIKNPLKKQMLPRVQAPQNLDNFRGVCYAMNKGSFKKSNKNAL